MKKIFLATAAMIALSAVTLFAQMGGGMKEGQKHEGRGSQHMMGGQMMGPEMMKDMSGVMNHMVEMMQSMSHTMGHKTVTEHMKMSEMSKVMEDMSVMMHTMSQNMAKGQMSPADTKNMREQLNMMKKKMEAMGQEGK